MEWIDLSPYWEKSKDTSSKRAKKKCYESTKALKEEGHFLGLLGEHAVGFKFGLEVNHSVMPEGDGGEDFPGWDVKGVTYWKNPDLKHNLDKPLNADFYILVGIDVLKKRGWIPGFATREELRSAPLKNYGYGDRLSLNYKVLHPIKELKAL
jgi:hypothetical protein